MKINWSKIESIVAITVVALLVPTMWIGLYLMAGLAPVIYGVIDIVIIMIILTVAMAWAAREKKT